MIVNESILENGEKIVFALREMYREAGYLPYRMSKFEEYDLYADKKDFLVSDNVITFTDLNGKLMALKPDVTLSIIKNSHDDPKSLQKVYYNENVYRAAKDCGEFREQMQSGVECFGAVGTEEVTEVLRLAARSMKMLSEQSILSVSLLDTASLFLSNTAAEREDVAELSSALGAKNLQKIEKIAEKLSLSENLTQDLLEICKAFGTISQTLPVCRKCLPESEEKERFIKVLEALEDCAESMTFRVDFSITDDVNYYNGIVFKGYIDRIPTPVLSGGQYDRLMRRLLHRSKAIGFAVYLDVLERLDELAEEGTETWLNVALPKGRLGEKVYAMFARAGFECPSLLEPGRKLIFENSELHVRYFWVKPSDVSIYVEHGAADVGVAGKDILLEYVPDVYELLDLGIGKCRMAVAGKKDMKYDGEKTLRVATKFSRIAREYYHSIGRDIDVIHLNGSIEIAPILGLSDVIVDIVETGKTLKENDLEIKEEIVPISARLIANKSACKFKAKIIEALTDGIRRAANEGASGKKDVK